MVLLLRAGLLLALVVAARADASTSADMLLLERVWARRHDDVTDKFDRALHSKHVTPPPTPWPLGYNPSCMGASMNLPQAQCSAWVALHDATRGARWNFCASSRLDPCRCRQIWRVCNRAGTTVVEM